MFSTPMRTAALVVAAAVLSATTACHDTVPATITAPQVPRPSTDRIIGVTMSDGSVVTFDRPARLVDLATDAPPAAEALAAPDARLVVVGTVGDRKVELPVRRVQRFHVTQEKGNTMKTVGLVAGIVAATVVTGVVVAGSFESGGSSASTGSGGKMGCCPFFYSWDGDRWVLDAEPYAGAITRGLERSGDVVLDHLRAEDGTYRVLMTNEREEIDHTDQVALRVVDHAPGVRVVPGDDGTLYPVVTPVALLSARAADGRDLTRWLAATDARVLEPGPPAEGEAARDEIVLTFPKPAGAQRVRLVARVGSSAWGSVMLQSFVALRGRELPAWYAALDGAPGAVEAIYRWNLEAELWGLRFEVLEPGGWRTRGALLGAGPLVVKERVVPLDLGAAEGDLLSIRIRPPRGYWALDSFAVDYSEGEPLQATEVSLLSAVDARGRDRTAALVSADSVRDVMPPGDGPVTLVFPAPPERPGTVRTVVLHAAGHYLFDLPGEGEPDREALRGFATEPDFGVRYLARSAAERLAAVTASGK